MSVADPLTIGACRAILPRMSWLVTAAVIVGAIVALIGAVLAVLCIRQGWDEGSRVEMPGGETIFDIGHRPELPLPPPPPRDR